MAPRTKQDPTKNGTPPEMATQSIEIAMPEAQLIYKFCTQAALPTVFEKQVAAVLQQKIETAFGTEEA